MGYYTTVRYLSGLTWSNINDIILNGKCLVEYNENSVCLYVCVCAQAHRYRYIYICIFWCFYASLGREKLHVDIFPPSFGCCFNSQVCEDTWVSEELSSVHSLGWWVKEAVDTAETFWSDLISGAQIDVPVLPPCWKGEGVNEVVMGEELL